MIIVPHETIAQGSDDWRRLRLGRPTSSEFDQIITPAKGQPSSSRRRLAARHVDERVTGGPTDVKPYMTHEMERGLLREHEARCRFERETGFYLRKVGFVATDDGRFGASPDALVYLDENVPEPFGCLEVKNYNATDHLLWSEDDALPNDFRCQVNGHLAVSGLKTAFWMSNCPPFSPLILRVDWDDFTTKLAQALDEFDRDVFRPMLARVCENTVLRQQVADFDAEYERMIAPFRPTPKPTEVTHGVQ